MFAEDYKVGSKLIQKNTGEIVTVVFSNGLNFFLIGGDYLQYSNQLEEVDVKYEGLIED